MRDVLAQIRAAAGSRALVDPYGSSVYAPTHASDVDVLVSHADPDQLATALGLTRIFTNPPRMSGELAGKKVDITVVNGDDARAKAMRSGPRDAVMLAAYLHDYDRDAVFQATWPAVKRFVKTRALGHNGLGWFGSFGWALLLAIPLVTELQTFEIGAAIPEWLRWLARLSLGSKVGLNGVVTTGDPFFLVAPAPPTRDVARLTKRAAMTLFEEARNAVRAIGDATTDDEALARIPDLATDPPPGTTLVISGLEESSRGRYDGAARGLIRELEPMGYTRSWGRFDLDEDGWQHRITVQHGDDMRGYAQRWLAHNNIDAECI
ncbi:MAG: hypothetical protein QM831_18285 [Kofleriaceae bacterium]